jgi:hypothetical protein
MDLMDAASADSAAQSVTTAHEDPSNA